MICSWVIRKKKQLCNWPPLTRSILSSWIRKKKLCNWVPLSRYREFVNTMIKNYLKILVLSFPYYQKGNSLASFAVDINNIKLKICSTFHICTTEFYKLMKLRIKMTMTGPQWKYLLTIIPCESFHCIIYWQHMYSFSIFHIWTCLDTM